MRWFRSIKADNVHGIYVQSLSEHAVREVTRALLDISTCKASDKVKLAALDAFKSKLCAPLTITGCTIDMG